MARQNYKFEKRQKELAKKKKKEEKRLKKTATPEENAELITPLPSEDHKTII